jgi:hypothetical protein
MHMNADHVRGRTARTGLALLAGICFAAFALLPSVAHSDDSNGDDGGQSQGSRDPELAANAEDKGQQIGTVLGTPIFESDVNANQNAKDNLIRLVFQPLTLAYCKEQGIDRAQELKARIKDEKSREMARFFVVRAELQRHLYEKYGGRVALSAFGPTAVDGTKKWIEDRERAGDFEITDPQLRSQFEELLNPVTDGAMFASPQQIKEAFDPAITDRFIQQYAKVPSGAHANFGFVLVGEVLGNPVRIPQRYIDDDQQLGEILYGLFVDRLEQHYRSQHPDLEPTDAEIAAKLKVTRSNADQAAVVYQRALASVDARLQLAEQGSTHYRTLEAEKAVVVEKLKRIQADDGRYAAKQFANTEKFRQHLMNKYGGRREAHSESANDLLDAHRRWLEEREELGEFQISNPKLREKFYQRWTKSSAAKEDVAP